VTAIWLVALAFAYFAGKHRGRGEGFAQGWFCAQYMLKR
jgi:hypothetical protein